MRSQGASCLLVDPGTYAIRPLSQSQGGEIIGRSVARSLVWTDNNANPRNVALANFDSIYASQEQTNSGIEFTKFNDSAAAIMELRRISGLTTEQLSKIFDVSRRSLHFWISGQNLNANNEEKLKKVLLTIRTIDRGDAGQNRRLLSEPITSGDSPLDLLAAGRYKDVVEALGEMPHRIQHQLTPLSANAWMARMPQKPEALIDALQEPIHQNAGKVRAAKSFKVKSGRAQSQR